MNAWDKESLRIAMWRFFDCDDKEVLPEKWVSFEGSLLKSSYDVSKTIVGISIDEHTSKNV